MHYASMRSMDISNGEGVGVSLFVQGCEFHCRGCFNSETWDFNGGKEWTKNTEEQFLNLIDRPYIKRISFLGGEPLAKSNLKTVSDLIYSIRDKFGESKKIWLYTGYIWDEITLKNGEIVDSHNGERFERFVITKECDIVVDGRFEENKKDFSLKFKGSSNQRVIDVKKSLEQNKVILYCD